MGLRKGQKLTYAQFSDVGINLQEHFVILELPQILLMSMVVIVNLIYLALRILIINFNLALISLMMQRELN